MPSKLKSKPQLAQIMLTQLSKIGPEIAESMIRRSLIEALKLV